MRKVAERSRVGSTPSPWDIKNVGEGRPIKGPNGLRAYKVCGALDVAETGVMFAVRVLTVKLLLALSKNYYNNPNVIK